MAFTFDPELVIAFSVVWVSGFALGFKLGLLQKVSSSIITGG